MRATGSPSSQATRAFDGSVTLHTSAYVSIRQHTSAYVSMRQHASVYVNIRQHTSAYVNTRQHTSAYVSIRQHTSAYVSPGDARLRGSVTPTRSGQYVYFCASKASKVGTCQSGTLLTRALCYSARRRPAVPAPQVSVFVLLY
jgi:hypothetical protein